MSAAISIGLPNPSLAHGIPRWICRKNAMFFTILFLITGFPLEKFALAEGTSEQYFDIRMDASPSRAEEYAKSFAIYKGPDAYVREIRLLDVDPTIHHHMILYLIPPGKAPRTMFVWSHAAPGYKLPKDSGLLLERGSTLLLDTHYLAARTHDKNGFRLMLTTDKPLLIARIGSLEVSPKRFSNIPPRTRASTVQTSCRLASSPVVIHAVMIHTHKKGTKVRVMKRSPQTRQTMLIHAGNPQNPQTFNPIKPAELKTYEDLMVECTYDTSRANEWTSYGVGKNEMCGTYFVYIGNQQMDCRQTEPIQRTFPAASAISTFGNQGMPHLIAWRPMPRLVQSPNYAGNLGIQGGFIQGQPIMIPSAGIHHPKPVIAVPFVPGVPNGLVMGY